MSAAALVSFRAPVLPWAISADDEARFRRVSRWVLNTSDAHGLYAKFGFRPVAPNPAAMELRRVPDA